MNNFLDNTWGIDKKFILDDVKYLLKDDEASILLACESSNFNKFLKLSTFKEIFSSLEKRAGLFEIQELQIGILNSLILGELSKDKILSNLSLLAKHNIITNDRFKFLKNFLLNLKTNEFKALKIEELTFHKNLENLNEISNNLFKFSNDFNKTRLQKAHDLANNAKFNIALTGVINSGKSSTLNKFLGKEIFGTSRVPETANLSVLEYSKDEFIKAIFFDGREEILNPENLINYTSAKNPLSKEVQKIILGRNLSILKDGICIIDTPGIDDAIKEREEITKAHMRECDFILHLMNISQAGTKKDLEFIKNTLKFTKTGGLVIVLTHADLVDENELQEAKSYIKSSILNYLLEANIDEKIVKSIKFFAISALSGFGMNDLKNYIYESFFGQSSKLGSLILENYKKELRFILENEILLHKKENLKLETSKNIKNDEISNNRKKYEYYLNFLSLLENKISKTNDFNKIAKNEQSAILELISRICNRIISDIRYTKKQKRKIDFLRIENIAINGINDLLIDFCRDLYAEVLGEFKIIFQDFESNFGIKNTHKFLDFKTYFDYNSLNIDYSDFSNDFINVINKNLKKEELLSSKLNKFINEYLRNLDINNILRHFISPMRKDFVKDINDKKTQIKIITDKNLKSLDEELSDLNFKLNNINDSLLENINILNKLNFDLAKVKE